MPALGLEREMTSCCRSSDSEPDGLALSPRLHGNRREGTRQNPARGGGAAGRLLLQRGGRWCSDRRWGAWGRSGQKGAGPSSHPHAGVSPGAGPPCVCGRSPWMVEAQEGVPSCPLHSSLGVLPREDAQEEAISLWLERRREWGG